MSVSHRVASIATVFSTLAAIIGLGTPGFAQQLDRVINAPIGPSVPASTVTPSGADAAALSATKPVIASDAASDDLQPGDSVAYGTLAAAVAAHPMPDTLDNDLSCMAGAIYFEAKGEPLSGQLAVAEVILNRTKSGRFPKSICSVVTQPGQFSFVRGGHLPAIAANDAYRTAVAVARVALADAWDSPAADAMYFHARRVAPSWHRVQVAAIGNHVFYR